MRGNHDCFDLPSWKSRVNYYRTHGKSANLVEQGKGVYSWTVNKEMGNYNFVAIDACPKKGPSRPLNFFGYLTSKTMDQLEKVLLFKPFNHTFVVREQKKEKGMITKSNFFLFCTHVSYHSFLIILLQPWYLVFRIKEERFVI